MRSPLAGTDQTRSLVGDGGDGGDGARTRRGAVAELQLLLATRRVQGRLSVDRNRHKNKVVTSLIHDGQDRRIGVHTHHLTAKRPPHCAAANKS